MAVCGGPAGGFIGPAPGGGNGGALSSGPAPCCGPPIAPANVPISGITARCSSGESEPMKAENFCSTDGPCMGICIGMGIMFIPSILFPVSRLLAARLERRIAADVLRLRCFLHARIRPRHAGIPPLITRMVLTVSHHVFMSIRIVLQERNGADAVYAGRERDDHGVTLGVTDHPRAHLIPAADLLAVSHPPVIGALEPHFAVAAGAHALGDRRPAV